jgi:uncharacterized RDD family membrane protein YckC
MRTRLTVVIGCVVATVLMVTRCAHAQVQTLPATGSSLSVGGVDTGGHGWAVIPHKLERHTLVHLPPRTKGSDSIDDTVPGGTVRRAGSLSRLPVAMAATGRRVVLVYEPIADGPEQRWPIRSMTAEPVGLGVYSYFPEGTGGGFEIEPSLVARGRMLGAMGVQDQIFVLLEDEEGASLHALGRGGWREVELPAGVIGPRIVSGHPKAVALLGGDGQLWLGMVKGVEITWAVDADRGWIPGWHEQLSEAVLEPVVESGGDETGLDPAGVDQAGQASEVERAPEGDRLGQVLWVGDDLARVRVEGDAVVVDRISPDGQSEFVRTEVRRSRYAVLPMVRDGRLVFLWPTEEASQRTPMLVTEVSAWTGRVMYDEEAQVAGPVSTRDFRLLALSLLAMMTGVLVFVLRQPPSLDAIVLPAGTALAPAGRRVAATLLDWCMLSTIAALILDLPLSQTTSLIGLVMDPTLRNGDGLVMAIAVLGLAWLWGTVFEGFWGRTPGKWLIGLRVGRAGSVADTQSGSGGLGRAAARNLLKWFMLPWAAAEAFSPECRHRGDQLTGQAVLVDLEVGEPSPETGTGSGSDGDEQAPQDGEPGTDRPGSESEEKGPPEARQ